MVEQECKEELFRVDWIIKEMKRVGDGGENKYHCVFELDPRRYYKILLDGEIGYLDRNTGLKFLSSQLPDTLGEAPIFYNSSIEKSYSFLEKLRSNSENITLQRGTLINNHGTRRRNEFNIKRYLKSVRGKQILMVVLYVDLVESTNLSASVPIEVNHEIIQIFYRYMDLVIKNYRGYIWKFNGDGIIGIFPEEEAFTGECDNAIQGAIMMASVIETIINPFFAQKGFPEIGFRIGIDIGEVMVVETGVPGFEDLNELMSYTMNLTSKIQSNAGKNEILIGNQLFKLSHVSFQEYFEKKVISDDWQFPDPTQKTMPYQLYKLRDGIRYRN